MGHDRLPSALLIVVAGLLLLPAAFLAQKDHGSDHAAQSNAESRAEDAPAARKGEAKSHARTVRLAGVIGNVLLDRPGSAKEDAPVVNTPIQEGFRLSSLADSYAVVELEHDSTAIMGQHSRLLFHQLALDANGNRLTGMTFEQGLATFHLLPQHHSPSSRDQRGGTGAALVPSTYADVYQINISEARMTVVGKCRFRVDVKGGHVRVEVFKGKLLFATPVQNVELTGGESLDHPLGGAETAFNIHEGIVKDPWDGWVELEEQVVLRQPKDAAKRSRQPQDLRATLRLRQSYPSTHSGGPNHRPPFQQ